MSLPSDPGRVACCPADGHSPGPRPDGYSPGNPRPRASDQPPLLRLLTFSAAVGLGLAKAHADIAVPGGATEDVGLATPIRDAPRIFQEYFDLSQFSVNVPTVLTGMEFRLYAMSLGDSAVGTWPSQNLTFSQYTVQLSQGSAAANTAGGIALGSTFAANEGPGLITVRSGALTIPANSFSNVAGSTAANPNAYGFNIAFTTPYLYLPGTSLVLTITESGYTPSTEPQQFFGAAINPITRVGSVVYATDNTSASPSAANGPAFVNFVTVPEPSTWALLLAGGAGALAGVARRRRVA